MKIFFLSLILLPFFVFSQARIALVIGNKNYVGDASDLRTCENDAKAVAKVLREDCQFKVILCLNLTKTQMRDSIFAFGKRLKQANAVGLFYYSGHGVRYSPDGLSEPENFLIPTDFPDGASGADLPDYAIRISSVIGQMQMATNTHNILVLDACRSYPASKGWRKAGEALEGLRPVPIQNSNTLLNQGFFIGYATEAGKAANVGVGDLSPYTQAFVQQIGLSQGKNIDELFTNMGTMVHSSYPEQQPYYEKKGDFPAFYFTSDPKMLQYQNNKNRCDNFFRQKEYARAQYCFETMAEEYPNDNYAKTQINACKQKIIEQSGNDIEEKYQQSLSSARYYKNLASAAEKAKDCPTEKANWELAKPFYEQCLQYKTNDATANEGVALCYRELQGLNCDTEKKSIDIPDDMILMKGGTFTMGTGSDAHSKTIGNYYMCNHELTFEEYDAFCVAKSKTKPDDRGWGRDKRPVINVSWYDAVEYCNWRSEQEHLSKCYTINGTNVTCDFTKKGYRLPTEAEWEYAARSGGKDEKYAGTSTDSELSEYANYNQNKGKTLPVKSKKSNGKGLYDMSGNVWEWCWDWYGTYSTKDIYGEKIGSYRVYRGGSWYYNSGYCASANRGYNTPTLSYYNLGFRLSRTE